MNKTTEHLVNLLRVSTEIYLIIPVPTIGYYENTLRENIEALKNNDDRIDVHVFEREEGYIHVKAWLKENKTEYTSDEDVMLS